MHMEFMLICDILAIVALICNPLTPKEILKDALWFVEIPLQVATDG